MADFVIVQLARGPGIVNIDAIEWYEPATGKLKLPKQTPVIVADADRAALAHSLTHRTRPAHDLPEFITVTFAAGELIVPTEYISHLDDNQRLCWVSSHGDDLHVTGVSLEEVATVLKARALPQVKSHGSELGFASS